MGAVRASQHEPEKQGGFFKELILTTTLLLYKEEKPSLGCSPCSTESSVMKDAPQGAEKLISFLWIQPLGPYSPAAEYRPGEGNLSV